MSGSKNREGAGQPKAAGRSERDREIERLTEVFKDAILHAPIPDVNPNLIRTVESQARECALRVVGEAPNEAECGCGGRICAGCGYCRSSDAHVYTCLKGVL